MKLFQVVVNGNNYQIQVEEIINGIMPKEKNNQMPKASSAPQLVVVPSERKDTRQKSSVGGEIKAHMPGIIGSILKEVGEAVELGETIMLLEAMKLENDVMASKNGVLAKLHVQEGQSVNAGEVLAEIE
ncbi:MAG: biotin/lipoyl-containing protein [Carboxydocellales bacterium]